MSAAMLRECFAHESKAEENFRKQVRAHHGRSPRGNRTGVLPVVTANTDVASLRRTRKSGGAPAQSPRAALRSPGYPMPYELPGQGIGFKVEDVKLPEPPSPAKNLKDRNAPKNFGRKLATKEFWDDFSGGGIACLSGDAANKLPAPPGSGRHGRRAQAPPSPRAAVP